MVTITKTSGDSILKHCAPVGEYTAHIKGAPNYIMEKCTKYMDKDGQELPLDAAAKQGFMDKVDELSEQALRVLAVATVKIGPVLPYGDDEDTDAKFAKLVKDCTFCGMCASCAFEEEQDEASAASADTASAVSMLVDLTRNIFTCASAVRLARNILTHAQVFTVSHIQAFFADSPDGAKGPTQRGAAASLDAADDELYALLVQHIRAADGAVSLADSQVPVTLAAVVAIFELAPRLSPRALDKIDPADLDLLLEFWPVLQRLGGDDALTVPAQGMESLCESLRHAVSAEHSEKCAVYLFLSSLLRLMPPSLSAVEQAPFGFWREPGKMFVSMEFSEMWVTNECISAVYCVCNPARIAVGDRVFIKPDSRHFKKDQEQTGMVIRDDGSSNPYIVMWSDGTESGWLEPQHLERVPEKATLNGRFEGGELFFNLSSDVHDEAKTFSGKLEKQKDSLVVNGEFAAENLDSGKGGFHLSLGKISESMQKAQRCALDLVSAVTEDANNTSIVALAEAAMIPLLKQCLTRVDDTALLGLFAGGRASDKVLLNIISNERPQFWGYLLISSQDRAIPFLQHFMRLVVSVESDKVIRVCFSNLVSWLVTRWHPLSSGSEKEEKIKGSVVDSFVHDASATVVREFVQTLRQLVEAAENEVGGESASLQIKMLMTSGGMREVLQMLSLLGFSIATSGKQHKEIKVSADLLGWIASAASLIDRAVSKVQDESVSKWLWPFCEMLSVGVGKRMSEMIWTKPVGSALDLHGVLFAGSPKLSSAPAFEHLLSRDSKEAVAKIDSLVQRKIGVHMSPFLDDLERHVIVLLLYHSGVIAKVLHETDAADLDEDTMALCTQASLKARQVRRNVMEIRSRHNQTLKDDEEPRPWDWFTGPAIKRCALLLCIPPMRTPATATSDPSSQSLSKFRSAAARVIKSQSEGAASLSAVLSLQKSTSDVGWQIALPMMHSHLVHRRLQLQEHSGDTMYEHIKVLTKFIICDNDAEQIRKELAEMQAETDYHRPLYTAVAHDLLDASSSLKLKLQWAASMWTAASEIAETIEHRPPILDRSDRSDDIQSWFISRQVPRAPKSIRLECMCADQGSGNSKGKLYARCVWSGGTGEWIEIAKVPHQASRLSRDLPIQSLSDAAQTPFQVELGFVVGGGGGHELHVTDAKLVIEISAKRMGETVWLQGRDFRPTSNLLLNRLCELIPHNAVVVRLLLALLSGASAEEGSFLVSTSIFKNLKQVVNETHDILTAKAIANISVSFLLHVTVWDDGVNPLFAKYTKEMFSLAFRRLVVLFPLASDDAARKVLGDTLFQIAQWLVSLGSASLFLISDDFMGTVHELLQTVDLDAPRLRMLTWCRLMISSPKVSESITAALAIKLHGLVIACSPERKLAFMGSGDGEEKLFPVCTPSIRVRAEAARCLRSLASQEPRAGGPLLHDTLNQMIQLQEQDSRDLALTLSLAGTLDVISLGGGWRLAAEIGAKTLQVCKTALKKCLLFETDEALLTRQGLRDLVFAVRALHAVRQLMAQDATLAVQVYSDEVLMKRLVDFATKNTGGAIPSTRTLEDIISKTYSVLENARLVPETDRLVSLEVSEGQERDWGAGDVMTLLDLESKLPTLVAAKRFKSGAQTTQQQNAQEKEEQAWQTKGNAFALACDLETELLALLSGLTLLQALERHASVPTPPTPAQNSVLHALSASSLTTVVAKHFVDVQSPEARALFKNGPCAKVDLLTPVVVWIRGKMAAGAASALDELHKECLLALQRYSAARSAVLLSDSSSADHMLCTVVVWQTQTNKFHIQEFAEPAEASAFATDKRAKASLARVYALTRKDSIWSLERLDFTDEEQDADALDAFNRQVESLMLAQLSTDNPGSTYFELTGSVVEYKRGAPDYCNVLSAKAISKGRHSFEFVMHRIGDEQWCGVTCRKDIAGVHTSMRDGSKCWTYYCGRRSHDNGALHLDGENIEAEHIKDGDIIGLVIDFSTRSLEFSKNGKKQGECCFPQEVKELYLVTHLDEDGDKVEVRPSEVAPEVHRLLTDGSQMWGSNPKRAPAWLKELMMEERSSSEARIGLKVSQKAGIGVALVIVESIQQTGGFSGSQISQVMEALATCLFLSGEPGGDNASVTCERLKVGMKVRLTANYQSIPGDARGGPLRPGDVGTLITDDESRNPYKVEFGGQTHWYEEGTIEEAVAGKPGTRVIEEKLAACIKTLMLSEHSAGRIEPGPYLGKLLALMRSNQLKTPLTDAGNSDLDLLIAFDRRQHPEGNLQQLLKPWIEQEAAEENGSETVPTSVSFTDAEGDTSTLKLDHATRKLSWHVRERCFLGQIRVLEFHESYRGSSSAAICAPENPQLIARLVAPAAGPARDLLLSDIVRMARSADGLEVVGFPTVSQPSESEVPQPPPAALPRGEFIAGLQGHFISAQGSRISIAKLPERDAFVWENKENLVKWELVPEKAGDDNIFATSGLNVMSTCPFYADGHVLLILEWKGKSVSKLHGPGGELFEPDKTRAGDKPHSPAIGAPL